MMAASKVFGDSYLLSEILLLTTGDITTSLKICVRVNTEWYQEAIRLLWKSATVTQIEDLYRVTVEERPTDKMEKSLLRARQYASCIRELVFDAYFTVPIDAFQSWMDKLTFERLFKLQVTSEHFPTSTILDIFDPDRKINILGIERADANDLRSIEKDRLQLRELRIQDLRGTVPGDPDNELTEILKRHRGLGTLHVGSFSLSGHPGCGKRLLQALIEHPSLTTLGLNQFTNKNHIRDGVEALFEDGHIELSHCFHHIQVFEMHFSSDSTHMLLKHLRHVKRLCLGQTTWSGRVARSIYALKDLTHLVLKFSEEAKLDGNHLRNIGEHCRNLIHLQILEDRLPYGEIARSGFTDTDIECLTSSLPGLEVLMLYGGSVFNITTRALQHIGLTCRGIRMLLLNQDNDSSRCYYYDNRHVSRERFFEAKSKHTRLFPRLTVLDLCTTHLYFNQAFKKCPCLDGIQFEYHTPLLKPLSLEGRKRLTYYDIWKQAGCASDFQ